MNKNLKKLTEGAILLGIYGAILAIDRYLLAHLMDTMMLVICACIIIVYILRNGNKYLAGMIIGVLFLTFIFGSDSVYTITGTPLGIIEGLIIGLSYKNNRNRNAVLALCMLIAAGYELLTILFVMPIFGFSINDDLSFMQETLSKMSNVYADAGISFDMSIFKPSLFKLLFLVSYAITGFIETFIIYVVSNLILRKMKINIPPVKSLYEINIHPLVGYISIFAIMGFVYILRLDTVNETIFNVLSVISALSMCVLLFAGYVFCLSYGIIVLKKKIGGLVVLFTFLLLPLSLYILIIFGFLYITGPLKQYLEKKRVN